MKAWIMAALAGTARVFGGRNARQVIGGVLFTLPLAVAVFASPPGWGIGTVVLVLFLAALVYLTMALFASDSAWSEIYGVAKLLKARDLRRGGLPEEEAISRANRSGAGQMGQLYWELRDTHGNLREFLTQAQHSADATSAASDEVASSNANLSQRTDEQASTLEQTAAAMEQLSATVRENAESCKTASEVAAGATAVARKGAEVAQKAVATMELIDGSSKRIVDIIGVIEAISFQTNILALNAAVEAARAGEQGRGFAVVASEVRSLAQRSAEAAKEIKALIDDSVAKVGQGTRLVNDTGRIIQEVTGNVAQVNELIGVIAVASREQASGVENVNKAVIQLQSATQHNAQVVQQAADASVTLKQEAERLTQLVGRFKIDSARGPRREAAPVARPAGVPARANTPAVAHRAEEEWQQF